MYNTVRKMYWYMSLCMCISVCVSLSWYGWQKREVENFSQMVFLSGILWWKTQSRIADFDTTGRCVMTTYDQHCCMCSKAALSSTSVWMRHKVNLNPSTKKKTSYHLCTSWLHSNLYTTEFTVSRENQQAFQDWKLSSSNDTKRKDIIMSR